MLAFRIGIDANPPLTPEEIDMRRLLGWPTEIAPDKERLRVVEIGSPCINEPGTTAIVAAKPLEDALTAAIEEAVAAEGRATLQAIYFTVNSADLRLGPGPYRHPPMSLPAMRIGASGVEGHTDAQGDEAYNLDLSLRRANAVRQALIDRYGVQGDRLETRGYGEAVPIADNATLEGRAQNRRVELVRLP
jgi:hypothetical protein